MSDFTPTPFEDFSDATCADIAMELLHFIRATGQFTVLTTPPAWECGPMRLLLDTALVSVVSTFSHHKGAVQGIVVKGTARTIDMKPKTTRPTPQGLRPAISNVLGNAIIDRADAPEVEARD